MLTRNEILSLVAKPMKDYGIPLNFIRVERARAALRATPPGWRPLGPDDELLRALLPDGEV